MIPVRRIGRIAREGWFGFFVCIKKTDVLRREGVRQNANVGKTSDFQKPRLPAYSVEVVIHLFIRGDFFCFFPHGGHIDQLI